MTANVVHPAELERKLQARVTSARSKRAERDQSRKRPSGRRLGRGTSSLVLGMVLALTATAAFADGGSLDVQVADSTEYAFDATTDGAIVEYIGMDNEDFGSSGTGVINSFLQTQDTPSEEGYNTNGTRQFDTGSSPTFNRAILVSEIPVVECEALDPLVNDPAETGLCWELFADINDSNAKDPDAAQIQLTELEIWLTANANLTGYVQADDGFPSGATEVYDFEGTILVNDVNSGSGRGDLRYLVPLDPDLATLAPDCDYGSSACATYFVVYTEWGDTEGGDYISDSGFEEWTVKRYPFLEVTKTATPTFTRTFPWSITKSVTPDTWALFDGDSGTSDYTVALTKGAGVDSAWAVSGTITVENTSDQDAPIASVTDTMTGGLSATVVCPVAFPYTLPDGDTLTCTYSRSLPDGTSRTNTATATLTSGGVFADDAAVTFGTPTTLVDDTVHVDDTYAGGPQNMAFSASGQTTYSRTFDCGDDAGTHPNTATIVETDQSDSASVTVTCYDLDVTKNAVPTFSRDFDWTIVKSVDPTSLDLFDGDSDDVTWTVEWTKSAAQDSSYAVSGQITVDNNHPSLGAVINSVTDVISPAIAATVDCGVTFPHTIAAGGSLNCIYSSDLPDDATRTNTATAVQQNHDYASDGSSTASGTTDYDGDASVDFTGVNPTVTDDTATLSDARPGNTIDGDSVSASGSASWDETFECGDDEGQHTNTATVTEDDSLDDDSDDASVTVNCYELTVTKDATTTYNRDYDWDIAKTRFIADGENDGDGDPLTLTLDEGQTYTASYEVTVTMTGSTDADHAVSGTITVINPAPIEAVDVVVTDVISPAMEATVDCDGDATVTIPANDSVECSYSADLPDSASRTNTATATLFGIGYDGTADVSFDLDNPTVEIDECVDITDDAGTPGDTTDDIDLGTVCVDDLVAGQWTDTYTMDIGPFAICGIYEFTNTVTLVTTDDENDTDENHSAVYTVTIDVPCPQGCTLTQGYWKTHNETFWGGAPADDTWYLLGDVDLNGLSEGELEVFFGNAGLTYFDAMWTAPQGNAYYQLSRQYIAAILNQLDGAAVPANVQDAIDAAEVLFQTYTPDDVAAAKGKGGKELRSQFTSLAGLLASYNEGDIGPGHCDEDESSDPELTGGSLLLADPRTSFTIG